MLIKQSYVIDAFQFANDHDIIYKWNIDKSIYANLSELFPIGHHIHVVNLIMLEHNYITRSMRIDAAYV